MVIYDTLYKMAESEIPDEVHDLLHVNSRQAWVNLVVKMIKVKKIKLTKSEIKTLLKYWEEMLIKHYSSLN